MPKRSNGFQKLAARVYAEVRAGLGPGWTVEESRMLRDSVTGTEREVDVVVEGKVGSHRVLIGIECRDHKRKQDTKWIEEMKTKHDHLPTTNVVLWSRNGFTEPAGEKARFLKVELVHGDDGLVYPWAKLARTLVAANVKYLEPNFQNAFVDIESSDGSRFRCEPPDKLSLRLRSGEATALAILASMRGLPGVRTILLDHAPEGSGCFYLEYKTPVECDVLQEGKVLGRLVRLGVEVCTQVESGTLESKSILYEGRVHTLGTAMLDKKVLEVFVTETGP